MRTIILALGLLVGSAALAADVYLADLLHKPRYRAAWNTLIEQSTVPGWVVRYGRVYDGPSQPARTVSVGGRAYSVADVCKPHDCGDNVLVVVFAPDGGEAWGKLTEGDRIRYLGQPADNIRRLLN